MPVLNRFRFIGGVYGTGAGANLICLGLICLGNGGDAKKVSQTFKTVSGVLVIHGKHRISETMN